MVCSPTKCACRSPCGADGHRGRSAPERPDVPNETCVFSASLTHVLRVWFFCWFPLLPPTTDPISLACFPLISPLLLRHFCPRHQVIPLLTEDFLVNNPRERGDMASLLDLVSFLIRQAKENESSGRAGQAGSSLCAGLGTTAHLPLDLFAESLLL